MAMKHVLSFDVENWYDGSLYRSDETIGKDSRRVLEETFGVLAFLARYDVKATFFVVGRVALQHPALLKEITGAGHEVACHTYDHDLLWTQTKKKYLNAIRRTRLILEDKTGHAVFGHRAAAWSLDRRAPWGVDAIIEAGYAYDSSIFPLKTPLYGEPGLPDKPHYLVGRDGRRLLELPASLWKLGPVTLPAAGGIYWRLLPRQAITRYLKSATTPQITYLHPWELYPSPWSETRGLSLPARLALTAGRRTMFKKLQSVIESVPVGTFRDLLHEIEPDMAFLPSLSLGGVAS